MSTEWVKAYASEIAAYGTEGIAKQDGDGTFYDCRDTTAEGYIQQDTAGWTERFRANLRAPDHVKVYRYMPSTAGHDVRRPPKDVDYRGTNLNRRLHPQLTFHKGLLLRREFCAEMAGMGPTGPTFNDAVVREDFTYIWTPNGLVASRDLTVSWFKEDGTIHADTKPYKKYYSVLEQIQEGKTRRSTQITKLQINVLGLLQLTETGLTYEQQLGLAQIFGAAHAIDMQLYVEFANRDLFIGSLQSDTTTTWLDNQVPGAPTGYTIRHFALDELVVIDKPTS